MKNHMFKIVVMTILMTVGFLFPTVYAASIAVTPSASQPAQAPTSVTETVTSQTPDTKPSEITTESTSTPASAPAPAEDRKVVAHVVWVKGAFYATIPGSDNKRELKTSSNVYMNDTLVTGTSSEAEIVFSDNSLMTFRPETKFYINEYNYQPKTKKTEEGAGVGRYVMDLLEGGFRTITGYVAKEEPDNYQVNTPVATIGVRGTEYSVVLSKDGKLFMKRYKGEPCVAKGKDNTDKAQQVCLNKKNKYSVSTAEGTEILMQEPDVFNVDVEVVPVTFSDTPQGFCGMSGCGGDDGGGGGSGFCIQ